MHPVHAGAEVATKKSNANVAKFVDTSLRQRQVVRCSWNMYMPLPNREDDDMGPTIHTLMVVVVICHDDPLNLCVGLV